MELGYLMYGVPIKHTFQKTLKIIEALMRESAEEHKETYPDLMAAIKKKLRKSTFAKRIKHQKEEEEEERIVPSLFRLCLKKIKRNAPNKNLPPDITQQIKRRKLAKQILWRLEMGLESDWELCECLDLLCQEVIPESECKTDHAKIQCCSPYEGCDYEKCEFFLCLHTWETLGREGKSSFELKDFQRLVDMERPLWWHSALQLLQIQEQDARPRFYVRLNVI